MSTLMEKDALLEAVAACLALITKKVNHENLEHSQSAFQDYDQLKALQIYLYTQPVESIDFDEIAQQCQQIRDYYSVAPYNVLYQTIRDEISEFSHKEILVKEISSSHIERIFEAIWQDLYQAKVPANTIAIDKTVPPRAYLLEGQPGSEKSELTTQVMQELARDVVVINGDDFRRYHPNFTELVVAFGKKSSQYTAHFSKEITRLTIERAAREARNMIIGGTFRTTDEPLYILQDLKDHNYHTTLLIRACSRTISWKNILECYHDTQRVGEVPRSVPKIDHDVVANMLTGTTEQILTSGLVDTCKVISSTGILFDSAEDDAILLPQIILEGLEG